MAHIDRQPSNKVFQDIKDSAEKVWYNSDFHENYIKEKVEGRRLITNYADNWAGFVQQFDSKSQIVFFECLQYQDTVNFLIEQRPHYSYFTPRTKR